ncbi:hypothetical protein [Dactylosporangium sp. NPDC051541]|uniref:hypothetical protein n=1 Tax=Dactylosporangium sp. NPDC051541 TaxID=3363977 RepID=UPI0037BC2BB5
MPRELRASIVGAVVMVAGGTLAGLVAGGGGFWSLGGFGLLALTCFVAMLAAEASFELEAFGLLVAYATVGVLLLLGAAPCYLAVDGRRVDATITGFRYGGSEGNRQSQVEVADPATEEPLGRIGFLGLERPRVGDTVPVLASRHGWFAPVGAETILTRAAGWLVAAAGLVALWSVRLGLTAARR